MLLDYGSHAYEVATRLARAERRYRIIDISLPPGHWERVRRNIKRRLVLKD